MKNLLLVFCLLIHVLTLSADDIAAVDITANPLIPLVDNPWTLSLIIDYPYPDDVSVVEPPFPLSLDRVVKYSKRLETKIQTVLEYRFIPSRSGSFKIGAFTVICPDGITETDTFNLDVHTVNEKQALPVLRLFWEINHGQISSLSPSEASFQMTTGERVLLVLRVNSLNSHSVAEFPPQEYFMPTAPQGAIFVLSPLSEEERAVGIMLKLTIIPLKGDFFLDARTLQHENFIFEIPQLFIRINEFFAKSDESAHITDTTRTDKSIVQKNTQYSELPASVNVQKITAYNTLRKFYIALIFFAIILVILTPIVCFLFFKNEKR